MHNIDLGMRRRYAFCHNETLAKICVGHRYGYNIVYGASAQHGRWNSCDLLSCRAFSQHRWLCTYPDACRGYSHLRISTLGIAPILHNHILRSSLFAVSLVVAAGLGLAAALIFRPAPLPLISESSVMQPLDPFDLIRSIFPTSIFSSFPAPQHGFYRLRSSCWRSDLHSLTIL